MHTDSVKQEMLSGTASPETKVQPVSQIVSDVLPQTNPASSQSNEPETGSPSPSSPQENAQPTSWEMQTGTSQVSDATTQADWDLDTLSDIDVLRELHQRNEELDSTEISAKFPPDFCLAVLLNFDPDIQSRHKLREFIETPPLPVNESLNQRWARFTGEEVKVTRLDSGSADLVKPSGRLDSRLILHLNYPTFNASHDTLEFGSCADPGNGCIDMLLCCGFTSENCMWIENSWRRENPDDFRSIPPIDFYPPALSELHSSLTLWIVQESTAKVAIAFGQRSRKYYEDMGLAVHRLDLGVGAWVEVSFQFHAVQNEQLKRIIVYTSHPERIHILLNRGTRDDEVNLFGIALKFAAAIAKVSVDDTIVNKIVDADC